MLGLMISVAKTLKSIVIVAPLALSMKYIDSVGLIVT